jgi:hypothetical protein
MAGNFRKVNAAGGDGNDVPRLLNTIQTNIEAALKPIQNCPIVDGTMIDVSVVGGWNTINHKLGRKMQGYIIVSNSYPIAPTHDDISVATTLDTNFGIYCGAAAALRIWVF